MAEGVIRILFADEGEAVEPQIGPESEPGAAEIQRERREEFAPRAPGTLSPAQPQAPPERPQPAAAQIQLPPGPESRAPENQAGVPRGTPEVQKPAQRPPEPAGAQVQREPAQPHAEVPERPQQHGATPPELPRPEGQEFQAAVPQEPRETDFPRVVETSSRLFVGVLTEGAELITKRLQEAARTIQESGRSFAEAFRLPKDKQTGQAAVPAPEERGGERPVQPVVPQQPGSPNQPAPQARPTDVSAGPGRYFRQDVASAGQVLQQTVAAGGSTLTGKTREAGSVIVTAGREFASAVKDAMPEQAENAPTPGGGPSVGGQGGPSQVVPPQQTPGNEARDERRTQSGLLRQVVSYLGRGQGLGRIGRLLQGVLDPAPAVVQYGPGVSPPPVQTPLPGNPVVGGRIAGGPLGGAAGAVGVGLAIAGVVKEGMSLVAREQLLSLKTAGQAVRQRIGGDEVGAVITERELQEQRIRKYDPVTGGFRADKMALETERMRQFQGARGAVTSRAEQLAQYSPEIAKALAQSEVRQINEDMRLARVGGPALAKFLNSQSVFDIRQQQAGTPALLSQASQLSALMARGAGQKPEDLDRFINANLGEISNGYQPGKKDAVGLNMSSNFEEIMKDMPANIKKAITEAIKESIEEWQRVAQKQLGQQALEDFWRNLDPKRIAGALFGLGNLAPNPAQLHPPAGGGGGIHIPIFGDILNRMGF